MTRVLVVPLWHLVWDAALLVMVVLAAPLSLGLIPGLLGYGLLVAAIGALAFVAGGYLGMGLVLRGDQTPSSWITPTIMNMVIVLAAALTARDVGVVMLAAIATACISAGMWLRLKKHSGVPVSRVRLAVMSTPVIALALVGAFLLVVGARYFVIRTDAMSPAVSVGDVVLATQHRDAVRQGDVVVIDDPQTAGRVLIRRVAGVDGDRVSAAGGEVTVPDQSLWLASASGSTQPDSGDFGPQPQSAVRGRVVAVAWPLSHFAYPLR